MDAVGYALAKNLYPSTPNETATKASLPMARYDHAQSTLNDGMVFVSGGMDGGAIYSTTIIYDPTANTWTQKANLPSPSRYGHSQSTLDNGMPLLVGGYNGSYGGGLSDVDAYDPTANTWTSKASITSVIWMCTQSTLGDGTVLVSGGRNMNVSSLDTVYAYDPTANTWTTKTPLPALRTSHGQSTLNDGSAIVVGGISSGYVTEVDVYDLTSNTWTSKAPLPAGRQSHGQTTVGDGRVVIAGGSNSGGRTDTVNVYAPSSNTWDTNFIPITSARNYVGQSTLKDGTALITGGYTTVAVTDVDRYDPGGGFRGQGTINGLKTLLGYLASK